MMRQACGKPKQSLHTFWSQGMQIMACYLSKMKLCALFHFGITFSTFAAAGISQSSLEENTFSGQPEDCTHRQTRVCGPGCLPGVAVEADGGARTILSGHVHVAHGQAGHPADGRCHADRSSCNPLHSHISHPVAWSLAPLLVHFLAKLSHMLAHLPTQHLTH